MRNAGKALGTTWRRNSFSLIRALDCLRVVRAGIPIRCGGLVVKSAGEVYTGCLDWNQNGEQDRFPRASCGMQLWALLLTLIHLRVFIYFKEIFKCGSE